jgi:hypothetical protein
MMRVRDLPSDYRWATAWEAEVWETLPDPIQVIQGDSDEDGSTMTDIAIPAAYPLMLDFTDDGAVIDCMSLFSHDSNPHNHMRCLDLWDAMNDPELEYK